MTAIAIALTNNEIIIGADSKVFWPGEKREEVDCKITQVGNVFFLCAGYVGNKDKNYIAKDYGIEAIKGGGSLQDIADRFTNLIQILADILSEFLISYPLGYVNQFNRESELEVAFVGFENASPRVIWSEYKLETKPDYKGYYLKLNPIDYTSQESSSELIQLGYKLFGEIDRENSDSITVVERIIRLAIEQCPLVGEPISIIRITAERAEWIKKGCC